MKRIILPILTFAIVLLTGCEDFNDKNFPGLDEASRPAQVITESIQLTNTDYKTISTTALKAALSKYNSDSLAIEADANTSRTEKDSQIAIIKNNYTTAKTKANNIAAKFSFSSNEQASEYITYLMPTLYKYADPGTAISSTYRTTEDLEANSFTYSDVLTTEDYTAMGTASGKPGQYKNFSSSIEPNDYLPAYCKQSHRYASLGEIAKVQFQWYAGSPIGTVSLIRYYKFDGTNWTETGKTDQFIIAKDKTWVFDPTITFTATADDYMLVMKYLYDKFLANGGQASSSSTISFKIPELEGYNGWTSSSVGRFVINWNFPPSGSSLSNVYTEYFFGSSWKYLDMDLRAIARTYADDIELQAYFTQIDKNTSLTSTEKSTAKTEFMEKRVIQGLALMSSLKYPNLAPQVKGIDQYVQVRIDEYDGSHKYWTYRFQCKETGKYKYISRSKWK